MGVVLLEEPIIDLNTSRNRKQSHDTNRKLPEETNRNRKWEWMKLKGASAAMRDKAFTGAGWRKTNPHNSSRYSFQVSYYLQAVLDSP